MDLGRARRLFRTAEEGLNRLETALFAASEAGELGLDAATEEAKAIRLLTFAADALSALAGLDPSAGTLLREVEAATVAAKAEPFDVVYAPSDDPDEPDTELFRHPLVLRNLLGRVAAIYALDPEDLERGLTAAQEHLLTICRNAAATILHLHGKRIIGIPSSEHDVKNLLYSIARASFIDAIPDGGIAFAGEFRRHKPDFGIPRLKCCVETKVARDGASMSAAIDGVVADQSNYGSEEYKVFIAVIYTDDDKLSQEGLDREIASRTDKGGVPKYEWHWVLIHGPLKPSTSRSNRGGSTGENKADLSPNPDRAASDGAPER